MSTPQPTSGLDSTTALNVMQTMRQLASGGRTIIASIHQPASRIYQEMDQVRQTQLLACWRSYYLAWTSYQSGQKLDACMNAKLLAHNARVEACISSLQLLLLSEGRTMYYGDAHVAADWFSMCQAPVPYGVNIAG
jgi:hypothetical protein